MIERQWQKACDCKAATATRGRVILSPAVRDGDSFRITATMYPEPVCDSCDTPWEPIPRPS